GRTRTAGKQERIALCGLTAAWLCLLFLIDACGCNGRGNQTAGAVIPFFPVRDVHAFNAYNRTGTWRMHEFLVAQIDAYMREASTTGVKKDKIAFFELRA